MQVSIDGDASISTSERRASIKEFYGTIFNSLNFLIMILFCDIGTDLSSCGTTRCSQKRHSNNDNDYRLINSLKMKFSFQL